MDAFLARHAQAEHQEARGAQAGDDVIALFERIISQSSADLDKATEDNPWYQVMASEVRAFASALATQPAEWIACSDRLPEVPEGDERTFLVSVRRGRYGESFVFEAHYLQDYPLYNEALGDEEGEYPATGWFVQVPDIEYEEYYEPVVSKSSSDTVTHWMPLPKPAAVRGAEHGQ